VHFRSRSDTEVILRLYEQDPSQVEQHLVGMWAFALHDRRRRQIVLSRDRFGIKPLFVADTGGALAFASELRCFDRDRPPFEKLFVVNDAAAHAMLSWSYVPGESTIYTGVRRLPPASRLTIDVATGRRRMTCYWRLQPSPEAARVRSLDEACESLDPLLRRAVGEHLESDVPVATFLSGGIDSSLVTAYALEAANAPVKAYSIGFGESGFDESPFARETASRLGVPIAVAMFDEAQARAQLADALLAYDEPFGDSSSLAVYLLSQHVARDFKVAIGGDGGDEVFAGYRKYKLIHVRRPFTRVPALRDVVGRSLARIGQLRSSADEGGWRALQRRLAVIALGLEGPDAQAYWQLNQWAPLARTAMLLRRPTDAMTFIDEMEARFMRSVGSDLQKTLAADLGSLLCDDMLVKVDRASMAWSLEARVPFLDHRLVEFGVGLPEPFTLGKMREPFRGKRVLRALHERRFGGALAQRRKQGFSVPIQRWLEGPYDPACERLFDRKRLDRFGLLASEQFSDGRFRRLRTEHPDVAWYAFVLAAWCEATLGDGPEALRSLLCEGAMRPTVAAASVAAVPAGTPAA
jgi:asparagine synthase (glutamine-hydrolysing)